jgi:hypothetical protein
MLNVSLMLVIDATKEEGDAHVDTVVPLLAPRGVLMTVKKTAYTPSTGVVREGPAPFVRIIARPRAGPQRVRPDRPGKKPLTMLREIIAYFPALPTTSYAHGC